MIPLHKLEKLPRPQRLRKAAKIFEEAQIRFVDTRQLQAAETEYLGSVFKILVKDESFSKAVIAALKDADSALTHAEKKEIHRALGIVHNLLLEETGRYQADWDFIEADGALDPSKRHVFAGMQVYLEDIRSPFNVGSMFRAAESFGTEKLWLSPICADPRHKRAERTAMGCVDVLPWERLSTDPFAGHNGEAPVLKGPFFAMEIGGIPLEEFSFPSNGVLIVGSEELGVSPRALARADASLGRVTIPTYGAKASLNASVAFGIVMQAWAREIHTKK